MRNIYSFTKPALLASTILMSGSLAIQSASAQDAENSPALDEIIVTAQKRTSDLQDVAISLSVLGNKQMEDLNINAFDDYIQFLPTVSFLSSRPGSAQIYMRGISSGGDGNHSGSMPSVGVYLDEQPITTIGQILDLHMYDIARIETLSGPQGTLFGSSSQAGTMRIITNKPVLGEFSAGYDVAGNTVKNGEMGGTIEAFANIPVADNMALRVVGWHEKDGGYIDNIPASITFLSGFTKTNASLVEKNYNDTSTTGMRALLKMDINENWVVTPGITYQKQKSTGSFSHDPENAGDLNTKTFAPIKYDEEFYQATLTVEGNIGGLGIVYAGAYLNRKDFGTDDYIDYAEYLDNRYVGYYGYDCLYYNADGVTCADPTQLTNYDNKYTRQSHEFRITTPEDKRLRAIAGVFYQTQTHDFDLQWLVPGMQSADSVIEGGHTTWLTKQVRTDRDWAAFSEVSFDVTDKLTVMGGARLYKYRNSLYGFNGFLRHCTGSYVGGVFVQDNAGTPQYPCFDTKILNDQKKKSGQTYKLNASYTIDDDKMVYATFSQGFRPGGVNRARVNGVPGYEPDKVNNYEFGWKTSWADNRLRFNGALYYIKWSDVQFAFLDFTVSNLTIIQNVGGSRTYGGEFDMVFAATEELTLSVSGSYNDAKLTDPYSRGVGKPDLAPTGTRMPFVPVLQFTAIARYETDINDIPTYFQAALSHTGKSWNDLDLSQRLNQKAYTLVNLSVGISKDNWTASIFADNVTDTRAQIARFNPGYPSTIGFTTATNRPRTMGVRFGQRF